MGLKRSVMGYGVVVGLLTMASHALAECVVPALQEGVVGFAVCKDWPAYPGMTITALSQIEANPSAEEPDGQGLYDLKLAVVSSEGLGTLASYSRASVFVSDAVRFEGLSIDTARYKLTPQLRAFGVRSTFHGSSGPNPFGEVWLSLYVKEGDVLRPVMEKLVVGTNGGEWDTNCAGEFWETRRTLEMASTSSHGYVDLIVRSVASGSKSTRKGEECENIPSTGKTALTTLRYDGNQYVVPNELKGI